MLMVLKMRSLALLLKCVFLPVRAQGLLEAATKYLIAGAMDRMNKVVVTWDQGGLAAQVVGGLLRR